MTNLYYIDSDFGFLVFSESSIKNQRMAIGPTDKEGILRVIKFWSCYPTSRGNRIYYLSPRQKFIITSSDLPFIWLMPQSLEFPESFLNIKWDLDKLVGPI